MSIQCASCWMLGVIAADNATDAPIPVIFKGIIPFLSFIRAATPIHLDGGAIQQSTRYLQSTRLGKRREERERESKKRPRRKETRKEANLVTRQSRYRRRFFRVDFLFNFLQPPIQSSILCSIWSESDVIGANNPRCVTINLLFLCLFVDHHLLTPLVVSIGIYLSIYLSICLQTETRGVDKPTCTCSPPSSALQTRVKY